MKIVVIHGQTHHGSTYHIARELIEAVGDNEVKEFFLPRDLNHFCLGCCNCLKDETKCPFYQDKYLITSQIEKADLLIFTTPTYCLGPSAPLKSFIDLTFDYWMPHKPKQWMFNKKAVVIATAAGVSTKSTIKPIKQTLQYWGVPFIKTMGFTISAMNWDSVATSNKAKINNKVKKVAHSITSDKIHIPIKTKFLFNMMAISQRKGMGSDPSEKTYWQENGWLAKERPWKQ